MQTFHLCRQHFESVQHKHYIPTDAQMFKFLVLCSSDEEEEEEEMDAEAEGEDAQEGDAAWGEGDDGEDGEEEGKRPINYQVSVS